MTIVVALLLAVAGFAVVAYPLLKPKADEIESTEGGLVDELQSKKDTTYSMIKELEFDHQSGILSEEDYRELETRYKKKAISLLKEADQSKRQAADTEDDIEQQVRRLRQGKSVDVEDEIEQQVRRLRQRKPADATDEVESQVAALRQNKKRFCTQCGARIREGDRFCEQCGASLT